MRHMLQVATATTVGMRARRLTALAAGHDDALGACLDGLTTGAKHSRLDLFTSQCTTDEPCATALEGDAAAVAGQTLDGEFLLLADRHLRRSTAATGLKAQVGAASGHQCAG